MQKGRPSIQQRLKYDIKLPCGQKEEGTMISYKFTISVRDRQVDNRQTDRQTNRQTDISKKCFAKKLVMRYKQISKSGLLKQRVLKACFS